MLLMNKHLVSKVVTDAFMNPFTMRPCKNAPIDKTTNAPAGVAQH